MAVADKQTSWSSPAPATCWSRRTALIGIGSGGNYALPAARALVDIDARRRGDRPQGDEDRRRHLHLHQPQRDLRKAMTAMNRQADPHAEAQTRRRAASQARRTLLAARDRLRARPLHRRPGRRQARRRHRAAQPLAPPAARRGAARGGDAEEHPDDRPDRRRQDRDRAPAGASSPRRRSSRSRRPSSPRSAMSAATSSRSSATWSRSRISHDRATTDASAGPGARPSKPAEERVLDALVGDRRQRRHARQVPQEAARAASSTTRRSSCKVQGDRQRHAADLRDSRHARRLHGHDQSQRDAGQGASAAAPRRAASACARPTRR